MANFTKQLHANRIKQFLQLFGFSECVSGLCFRLGQSRHIFLFMKKFWPLIVLFIPIGLESQPCQITSPLPIPITIQGCNYNANLPGGSTSYIQNSSTLQAGATAYPDFIYTGTSLTSPIINDSGLTSGMCVQAGTNGILTSAAAACGSGGGGGFSVYPATSTIYAPSGINVSTITIGSVQLQSSYDTTAPATNTLIFRPIVDQQRIIRFLDSSGDNLIDIDSNSRRIGFFTPSPDTSIEMNGNVHIDGQMRTDSGIKMTSSNGSFSFQGSVVMTSGSAVVTNAIVDSTYSIYLTIQSPSGVVGSVYVSSVTANTTFNILSTSAADNSTVGWLMVQH
jgi:hypothetical protein